MRFLDSYIGMFITQSILHSFITVILVEIALHALEIGDHLSKFRYRLLTLTLPVLMFPLYQIINLERGSLYFRENSALFDSRRWLDLQLLDVIPVRMIFFAFLSLTVLIFIIQEIVPIIREKGSGDPYELHKNPNRDITGMLARLCDIFKVPNPSLQIVDEPYPLLFTSGIRNHTIVLSNYLLDRLNDEQLESALAHEVVHMMRGSSLKTQFIYILRVLMFYNPVSLLEFRRLVQDDEFLCDDITICITKKPEALSSALNVFYAHPDTAETSRIIRTRDIIESHSHNLLLSSRIRELEKKKGACDHRFGWGKYMATILIILKINYLVV